MASKLIVGILANVNSMLEHVCSKFEFSLYASLLSHHYVYSEIYSRLKDVFWRCYTWRRGAVQTSGKISTEVSKQGGHGDTVTG